MQPPQTLKPSKNQHPQILKFCVFRRGAPIGKKDKGWEKPQERNKHIFCVEDPFDVNVDLGRNADENTIEDIRQEFERAYKILAETGDLVKVSF